MAIALSSLMASSRPVLLLTGFGPFPRVPVNATSLLVPRIAEAADKAFAGIGVVCEIIPTEWRAGLARVEGLYAEHRPLIAIHFGVSGRATGLCSGGTGTQLLRSITRCRRLPAGWRLRCAGCAGVPAIDAACGADRRTSAAARDTGPAFARCRQLSVQCPDVSDARSGARPRTGQRATASCTCRPVSSIRVTPGEVRSGRRR